MQARQLTVALLAACFTLGAPGHLAAATEDRLTTEQMTVMAAAPMAKVESGDIEGARRDFAGIASAAPSAAQRADLLTSFAIGLVAFEGAHENQTQVLEAAIAYLSAAVPEYRVAYGSDHAEVALALNTLADAKELLDPANPPSDVETRLEEADRIRTARFGLQHPETLAGSVSLAEIMGLAARTKGQPARIDAAIDRLRRVIAADREDIERDPIARAYFSLAVVQVDNERSKDAEVSASRALEWALKLSSSDTGACGSVTVNGLRLVNALRKHDLDAQAESLLRQLIGPDAPCPGIPSGAV